MSVVDRAGKVLLDELVRQERPVTDYLTEFSGMSAALLDGVQTTLTDVQARLRAMLCILSLGIDVDRSSRSSHPHATPRAPCDVPCSVFMFLAC